MENAFWCLKGIMGLLNISLCVMHILQYQKCCMLEKDVRRIGRQQYLRMASKWNSMFFLFLLAEDIICKDLLEDRKYMADEEISADCECINDMPKESETVTEVCFIYF